MIRPKAWTSSKEAHPICATCRRGGGATQNHVGFQLRHVHCPGPRSLKNAEAFLPTDRAFRRLAHSLTGKWYHSEKKVFTKLAGTLGVDTIESVLLYHVVPGATITYRQALKANGAVLQTALEGATIKVKVRCWVVILKDNDPNARNPIVVQPNLNKGNKQIGHGINRVLRPVDL